MRYFIYWSLIGLLTGCLATSKPGPESAVYDFGLNVETGKIDSNVDIGKVTAVDAIDHRRIRYRLNYQNPSQVFTYTQSRWASSPANLLAAKFRTMVNISELSNCGINLQIEAFDQVFESPGSSAGLVKIHASLYAKKSRQNLLSHMVQENAGAPSADGKGGVAALDTASTNAILRIVEWANTNSAQRAECGG
jgi:cholesterol transport system auxiliary component